MLTPAIGSGGQGEVFKAYHFKTKETRAMKVISKEKIGTINWNLILNEIKILREIDHPNIVKIYEFFETVTHFYIVMEYCPGKTLFKYFNKDVSEKEVSQITYQILETINYLHKIDIVHRDIKSDNIIFNGKTIKLIDFGMSKYLPKNKFLKDLYGTKDHMSPELIKKKYNHKVDIWAIGIICFMMICGKTPFKGNSDADLFNNISKMKFE